MFSENYSIEKGRLVLIGLTFEETAEFEYLDAQIPFDGELVWLDMDNSPVERRWLELYTKHATARRTLLV